MENVNTLMTIAGVLIIPLIPAFVIYKFLPSKTVVKGPFKGLHVNLTGAFSGYFLLVIISLGFTYSSINNDLKSELIKSKTEVNDLNARIDQLNREISKEKTKYQPWKMFGIIDSKSPEMTKIFVDEENISINALGKFTASLLLKCDEKEKAHLPSAICFFNKGEGYNVIDLSKKEFVNIDPLTNLIEIKEKIKLTVPVKYIQQGQQQNRENWYK